MTKILHILVCYMYIFIILRRYHCYVTACMDQPTVVQSPPPPPQVLPSLVVASITSDQCSVYYIFLYDIYIYIYIYYLDEISLLCYSMHGPAHCCPHPRVLPSLVTVHITSGQCSVYYIFLYIYIILMRYHCYVTACMDQPTVVQPPPPPPPPPSPAQSGRCLYN